MTFIAKAISYVFHPLFIVVYMLGVLMLINPFLFEMQDRHSMGLLVISVVSLSVFFPLLSILLMRGLGLIESLEMKSYKERVGPLIATGIFYLWLYINFKNNPSVPGAFTFFVLGSTIGLFIGFFINNFSRVSLHAIGIGGFLAGLFLIRYNFAYDHFTLSLGLSTYLVKTDLLVFITIAILGLIGTSRLKLGAHSPDQIYGGYLVGAVAQIIAYLIAF